MKASRSQTKVLFAYQLEEGDAHLQNPGLDSSSDNICIRVVQYLTLGAYFNSSEFDESSEGKGSLKTDFLSSAIITNYTITRPGDNKLTEVEDLEPGAIRKIVPCLYKNYRIVDIVVDPLSAIATNLIGKDKIVGVLIGLQFDSGSTEDLFLTVVEDVICNVDLDSEHTRSAAGVYGALVDSGYGPLGSIEINTNGFGESGLDTFYSAFSWAKYYKQAKPNGELAEPGCLQVNESQYSPTHQQFYTGWGVAVPLPQPGTAGGAIEGNLTTADASLQSWAISNGYYASPSINIMPWVTGRSDLTKSVIHNSFDLEYREETQCNVENNPLGRFFGLSAPFQGTTQENIGTGSTVFIDNNANTSWGQHFGWLTTPPGFVVKNKDGEIITSSRVWGTSPAFTAAVNPGKVHNGIALNQSLGDADNLHVPYAELSKSWFGSFPNDYQGYMEAGDAGPTSATAISPGAGVSLAQNQISGSSALNRDPLKRRFNRLFHRTEMYSGPGQAIQYNYNWFVSGFEGGTETTNNLLFYARRFTNQSGSPSSASNFYVSWTNREYALNGYAWITCANENSGFANSNSPLRKSNSLMEVRATRGVNFFYTGSTAVDDSVLTPVFKGHGKVIRLLRASGFGAANISELVRQTAAAHINDGVGQASEDFRDLNSYVAATQFYNDATVEKRFNGIDLLFNLIYRNHGYPDDLRLYGKGSEQFFNANEPLNAIVINSYYNDAPLSTSEVGIPGSSLTLKGRVQDIAYLVEGFNRVNVPVSTDYSHAAFSLNNPLESPWSDRNSLTSYTNLYTNLEASEHRPFQLGPDPITNFLEYNTVASNSIYSAAPVGGSLNNFGAPSIGNSPNFAHSYTDDYYDFGNNSEDYPNGGSDLTGRQLKLPSIDPTITQHRDSIILDPLGEKEIVKILAQSVAVQNLSGAGDSDTGFPQTSANNQNLQIEFVMRYQFTDDTTEFQTDAGDRAVTLENEPFLSNRVTKVLQVWNHIEIIPLSRLSEDGAVNSFGVEGQPSFAYRQSITSADHVDDISIVPVSGFGEEVYELRVKIRADEDDVYNNPEYIIGEEENAFTAIIPDVQYDISDDYRAGTPSAWKTGYETSDTDADNGSSKASFIVVAHASTWENTAEFTISNDELVGPKSTSYVLHTPYVTYGGFTVPEVEEFEEVPGCTDPNALNYVANANTDDGSCQFCDDALLDIFETHSIDSAWNVGAYQPDEDHHMFNGLVAGLGSSYNNTLPNTGSGPYLGSNELKRGGTVMCNNAFIGDPALCNLSIKGQSHSGIDNFTSVLTNIIGDFYGETAESCWRLRIIPMTDAIVNDIPFTNGTQVQDVINADNVPNSIANATAIYDSYANGGTLQNPEWNNIAEESTAGLSGNLKAGNPYLLEMIFDPTKLDGTDCASFLAKNYRMYGMFWTAFCSCATTDNNYYTLALNGNGYEWNNSHNFPVLPYGVGNGSDCPDAIPGNLLDDGPYFGTAPDAANATVCFQNDDELVSCDTYFLSCVVGPFIECATLAQVEDGTVTPIDLGNGEFQLPLTASIEVNLEGVYDAQANQLLSTDNIQYNVTVTGPDGYSETQTQADTDYDADNYPFYINIFDNITVEGTYIVDVVLIAPYPDGIQPVGYPCSDQFEFQVENQCAIYIEGCTDPIAANYDPNATQDNGTCEYDEPCEDVYLNTALSFTATTTNSTSSCGQDTITFEGQTYNINVPVPNNDGSVTVEVTYTFTEGAVSAYAIALIAQGSPLIGNLNNQAEVMEVVFANYPTSSDTEGVDLTGTAGSQIAFWSPLFQIGDVPNPNTHTFTGIAPGNYYVLVVPDIQTDSLDPAYLECAEEPFLKFEDYLTSVFVGQDAAPDCEEECLNPPCEEYTYGCTNPNAENYNPDASYDDGSCVFTETFCEQNPNDALCEDCTAANEAGGAQSRGVGVRQTDGTLDETICDPTVGTDGECTDPNACNYNPNAPLDVSNNLLCDYCSCIDDQEDPDCFPDTGCDPAIDPNCGPPQPECPDPSNPACDPEPFDPCPTGDCIPPGDPCLILGNCGGGPSEGDPDDFPDFIDDINPVEVICLPDIDAVDESELGFSAVQNMAFKCMGEEGTKLLFKLKAGVDCSQEELTKLSLIAYLFAGGLENTLLPCLFNCNYESQSKLKERNCIQKWVAGGARVWNKIDTFQQGDYCVYYYQKNGVVTRAYYEATRDIEVGGLQPRYPGSGWHRCQDVKLRKADRNGIADGTENYLTVMYEYLTRYCTSCQIGSNGSEAQAQNNVDQSSSQGYLPPKINADERNNINTGSGILGEDGEEIIF